MKKPKKRNLKKNITLALLIIFNQCAFFQTTCNDPISVRTNITLCQGETYQFGDRLITTAGIYIQTFNAIATNCDSIVTLVFVTR
ncbi:MAG: hypothetical protein AB8G86_20585 [Saprospiraceae bacterium]